ncbi:MAG: hypothetical protein HF978_10735 [Desulfobacteraceae bacterium]|nr:hypothetical protein [Desulfobacteraceae bacterium]MBC2756011.1 hypothetical protein [Desulfobacteraceae bacterium]
MSRLLLFMVYTKIYIKRCCMSMEKLEDYQLSLIVKDRQNEKISAVEVDIDEL